MLRKLLVIFLPLLLVSAGTTTQFNTDTQSKIKAMYIFNFAKNIEWPSEYKQGNFVIGVLGKSNVFNQLGVMSKTQKVFNQKIEVQNYLSRDQIGKCHMLYIPPDQNGSVKDAIGKLGSESTLVVTENADLANNTAGINFVIINYKQEFELNKSNVEKRKLKVSIQLENLASKVY